MFGDYFRHLLITKAHEHFPNFERTMRTTIEDGNDFIAVIRESNNQVRINSDMLKSMKTKFLAYLKRRGGSFKTAIRPCQGTVGRWNKRRSLAPIMELTYECYDAIYYANWIQSDLLDRLVWSNITPVIVSQAHCPHGAKSGIIFIIN